MSETVEIGNAAPAPAVYWALPNDGLCQMSSISKHPTDEFIFGS
jgi:hypothetical protein